MCSQPNEELKEITISDLYNEGYGGHPVAYEIPVYQRNYAWEKEEISALIQDVYHAFSSNKANYYIGTLVSFCKGDQNGVRTYEVIDGQQRLTTIFLILNSLGVECTNHLTYKARKKANDAIKSLMDKKKKKPADKDEDDGIGLGFDNVESSLKEIALSGEQMTKFKYYFQDNVHIIHYQVPKDIDLNHYFEIMNSRGEQLEMSEIIKARLMETLNDVDKAKFSLLWECCSEMNVYVQQKYAKKTEKFTDIFEAGQPNFKIESFDELPPVSNSSRELSSIDEISEGKVKPDAAVTDNGDNDNSFQPIMDFANFLLIVLKLTVRQGNIVLDDKELLNQFDKIPMDKYFVKNFGYNLLKARFFLDNYIVHHSCEGDTTANNPWELQYWKTEGQESYCVNLGSGDTQEQLIHLLSMFEVSYTPRQRKNYLFYCLLYLFEKGYKELEKFRDFVSTLADKYFWDVYMAKKDENNVSLPKSFDEVILPNLYESDNKEHNFGKFKTDFANIYGGETTEGEIKKSPGIPLFIFNYLDYKIWKKYSEILRGKKSEKGIGERKTFFDELGCSDFGLGCFDQFYFSRTRRSLEHYFPQANVDEQKGLTEEQINCFGNLAMIGGEANSSGSNWSPNAKLDHYLDSSGKISRVSVASLKFMIMMQICKDNANEIQKGKDNDKPRKEGQEWIGEDINDHQEKMLKILWQP